MPRGWYALQGIGPVAVTSTLLGNGLSDFMVTNEDPNNPDDPQVGFGLCVLPCYAYITAW
jgi:hypothetical protein